MSEQIPNFILQPLLMHFQRTVMVREPDLIIGGKENPYLMRWHIIREPEGGVKLHRFLRSDDDRALHCHPWENGSLLLEGNYIEHMPGGIKMMRSPGHFYFRPAIAQHRVELLKDRDGELPVTTLFFTGRRVREWGFACEKGWVPHYEFTAGSQGEYVGKGCGE